jgi:cytochrome c6
MTRWLCAAIAVACVMPASAQDGAAVFGQHCEVCHGKEAKGANAPALVPYDRDLDELVLIVRQGVGMMPAFPRDRLSDADVAQIHGYLKTLSAKSGVERVKRSQRG